MGSILDVARCKELSLLQGTWCSFDRFLNVRDTRRGDSKAPRDRLQRFLRRAPQQVDGGLVRVAVRTSEGGVHGKSIGGGHVAPAWRCLDTRSRSITTPRSRRKPRRRSGSGISMSIKQYTEQRQCGCCTSRPSTRRNWCRSPSSRKMGCWALPRAVMW